MWCSITACSYLVLRRSFLIQYSLLLFTIRLTFILYLYLYKLCNCCSSVSFSLQISFSISSSHRFLAFLHSLYLCCFVGSTKSAFTASSSTIFVIFRSCQESNIISRHWLLLLILYLFYLTCFKIILNRVVDNIPASVLYLVPKKYC